MSILTSPALRWPRRVTPELHFDGTTNSNVDCGAIHNAAAKLWISGWFKLDVNFSSASAAHRILFFKDAGAASYIAAYLNQLDGKFRFQNYSGGVADFEINSVATAWAADTWHHYICSISDVAGARLILNGGTAVIDADKSAAPDGGNLFLGEWNANFFFLGEQRDVSIGIDDLTLKLLGTNTDLVATNLVTQAVSGAKGYVVAAAAGYITVARTNATAFVSGQDVVEDGDANDKLTSVILDVDEERDLLKGIIPADATEFYRLNEGYGTTAIDLGTGGNDGTIDSGNTWETGLRQYVRW